MSAFLANMNYDKRKLSARTFLGQIFVICHGSFKINDLKRTRFYHDMEALL